MGIGIDADRRTLTYALTDSPRMVDFDTDGIPLRGIGIGVAVLVAGTLTATVAEDPMLPALVAAVVLLVSLLLDDRLSE